MNLVGDPSAPRLIASTGADLTDQLQRFTEKRLREFEDLEICGYVCKERSPSCGMAGVNIYDQRDVPSPIGIGLFTRTFMERFPLTPVEEAERLHDALRRESFLGQAFARQR